MSVDPLLASAEPAVRLLTRTEVLGESPGRKDRAALVDSDLVRTLSRDFGLHPYAKWQGAHWRLNALVELGVPARHEGPPQDHVVVGVPPHSVGTDRKDVIRRTSVLVLELQKGGSRRDLEDRLPFLVLVPQE